MKPLIDEDSLLYRKRLVRELNQEGMLNGFYAIEEAGHGTRCNRARIRNGQVQVRPCADRWFTPNWPANFWDPNGSRISASRHPR